MGYFLALTLTVTSEVESVRYFRDRGDLVNVDRRTGRVWSLTVKGKGFTDKDLPRLARSNALRGWLSLKPASRT
jgi:hypothetical protein